MFVPAFGYTKINPPNTDHLYYFLAFLVLSHTSVTILTDIFMFISMTWGRMARWKSMCFLQTCLSFSGISLGSERAQLPFLWAADESCFPKLLQRIHTVILKTFLFSLMEMEFLIFFYFNLSQFLRLNICLMYFLAISSSVWWTFFCLDSLWQWLCGAEFHVPVLLPPLKHDARSTLLP